MVSPRGAGPEGLSRLHLSDRAWPQCHLLLGRRLWRCLFVNFFGAALATRVAGKHALNLNPLTLIAESRPGMHVVGQIFKPVPPGSEQNLATEMLHPEPQVRQMAAAIFNIGVRRAHAGGASHAVCQP